MRERENASESFSEKDQLIQSGIAEILIQARKKLVRVSTSQDEKIENDNVEALFTPENFRFTVKKQGRKILVEVEPIMKSGDVASMSTCFYVEPNGKISWIFESVGILDQNQVETLQNLAGS